MPKNNKNIIAKNIDGKKIREQYFDGILIGFIIAILCHTVWSFFDYKNFLDNLLNIICIIVGSLPFFILAILNRFVFGKILCVLSKDRLYYFGAETRMNSRIDKTNGYVEYKEILNIEYVSPEFGVGAKEISRVIIYGENFKITIWNVNRSLVKKINKKIV